MLLVVPRSGKLRAGGGGCSEAAVGRVRPSPTCRVGQWSDQTESFRAFRGSALITLRAGLALMSIGSLVNGLMPCLALVAGLLTRFSLIRPGIVNRPGPFLPSSLLMRSVIAS